MEGFTGMETEVTRLLDGRGIEYRLLPHKKPAYTCEAAAVERNVPLDEMIKCILLVDRKKNYYLVCIAADKRVDTKRVRGIVESSRLSFASGEEIEDILGYKMGAVPPLLLKTDIPVILDDEIEAKKKINISSGDPKMGLELGPESLISLMEPVRGSIAV